MERWWMPLPEDVSTFGPRIDSLFFVILWITGIVFILVEVLLVYYLVKYRAREGRRAIFSHGNKRLEIIWTTATFAIVFFLGLASRPLWSDVKEPSRFPRSGLALNVTAKQFEWHVTYPGPDGRLGTADDFEKRNELDIPMGVPIHVTLRAEDVIHSFFLPQFRLKQDAVPGMEIPAWFQATKTGEYVLGCAELCGLGHYRMRGRVIVRSPEDFQQWLQQQTQVRTANATP
ncbi:MAG TPA: cytochrome c oxidase subunit II [Longimicrobiales bacterium]|nr:cytochrome c oxidase subunit II [Longimicrobiales bacterium]